MPGQIGELALVMAVNAARVPSTTWARGGTLNWPHIQIEPPIRGLVATDNRQTCRNGRNRRCLDHVQIPSLTVIPTLCPPPIRVCIPQLPPKYPTTPYAAQHRKHLLPENH